MVYSFTEFLNEKYGNFEDSIPYTDWTDFKEKLKSAIQTGFKTEEELVSLMGMDYFKYTKIRENMIMNWKDSVSKSLLHSVAQIGQKIPKKGANIFKDLKQQTQFLILASNGLRMNNVFGASTGVSGLNMIYPTDLQRIKNKDPKNTKFDFDLKKDVMKNFVDFNGVPAYTVFTKVSDLQPDRAEKALKRVNEVVQYVWLYAFYHHYKIKKDKPKLPKYLYRGIRSGWLEGEIIEDLKNKAQKNKSDSNKDYQKKYIDSLIDYIVKNGISKISTGKLLSFTESRDIAAYFANKEGIILRVDPKKVQIVSSPKTEEFFQEADYVSGKKEKEYIIKVPANYKFTKDDIEIVHGDYLESENNPLSVQFFDHDNRKANYELDGLNIEAQYVWSSNTVGRIVFRNYSDDGRGRWGMSRREFKKTFNVDPMPTEDNLDRIKDFKISPVKSW